MKLRLLSCRALAIVLGLAASDAVRAQTVTAVTVARGIDYVQTSATDVHVDPTPPGPLYGGPYGFGVNVEGTNVAALAAPTVTGPFNLAALGSFFNGGKLVYSTTDGFWRLGLNGNDWGSPTQADLDSKFGFGTYTVSVAGTSVALAMGPPAYPNAPLLTLSGGAWVNGKYMIDADHPLTLTTSAYTAYGTHVDDQIEVGAATGSTRRSASTTPGANTATFTIPASTLVPGREYTVGAIFTAVVDARAVAGLPSSANRAIYRASTGVTVVVSAPVFPMVVTGTITPSVANITAAIKYRPEDVGSNGSVYVFALAPADMVKGAVLPAGTEKDTALACVLAQLSSAGQLTAVSASSLQAYLTGVLGSQGASINVLNSVSTAILQGAVFYVGYGATSAAMINSGVNRSVVTVPGSRTCQPQAPEGGWWWNRAEGGRGFSIETRGNRLFMAGYLYDASGRSTWTASGGLTSLDGSFYHGDLAVFSNGQTLTGPYKSPAAPTTIGQVTLAFTDARNGTLVWPGGAMAIERFDIAPPTTAAKFAFQPENGWWWNSDEGGRGYFMEFNNNSTFVAGYMYDASGNPLWYVAGGGMGGPTAFSGTWAQYANGQTLTGTYHPPIVSEPNVGPVAIQFDSASSATLTLPGGRRVPIKRYAF